MQPPCRLIYPTYQNVYGVFFNKAKPEVVEKARMWYKEQVCSGFCFAGGGGGGGGGEGMH